VWESNSGNYLLGVVLAVWVLIAALEVPVWLAIVVIRVILSVVGMVWLVVVIGLSPVGVGGI